MIEVLKQALEALEQLTWAVSHPDNVKIGKDGQASLRQAIAELESQEPQIKTTDSFESAKVKDYNRGWNDCLFASGIVKQSQRTWVGLTDEDIGDAYVAWDDADGASFADFARAIEAKLKQKNGYAEEKNT